MQPDTLKNIWLFNQYAITPDQAGGSRHYSIGKSLTAKGYNVTIFASGFNYQKREETKGVGDDGYSIEVKDDVRFVWIKTVPYTKNNWKRVVNMLSYTWRCLRIYKKLIKENRVEEPGIVIGSSVHLFAVWAAYRIAKKLKAKFVMEVRDLWPMTLVEFRKELKYHPMIYFFKTLDRFLSKRALRVISVLPGAYEYYRQYGIEKDRVVWIPNGVDTTLYPGKPSNKNKEHFKIMYTGAFGMEANLQTLLEAAKSIREKGLPIVFELIGSGEKQNELMETRDSLGLSNVEFRKPVNKKEIPGLLATADALWIGSRRVKNLYRYGFSFNKLFEYLASGKPILFCVDSTYNPVKDSGAGLVVPPEDPVALSEAIIKLYETPEEERIQMGKKGIAHAKEFYDMETLGDKFDVLLSHLNSTDEGV